MAKITAVIDIGSNSVRMAVYKKSSRFAFNLIYQIKSPVRISEGSYDNNSFLQEIPMQRAYNALEEFLKIAKSLKCRKILTIATSAIRDAKNRNYFINRVRREIGLNIKVIDGEKEALYGAISAINLLPKIDEFVTIDIGGGSTELAKVKNGKIIKKISLRLGTVRLKELFFDKNDKEKLSLFFENEFKDLDEEFKSDIVVGIGGSIRTLSKVIMNRINYPLNVLHAFEYQLSDHKKLFEKIENSSDRELKKLKIKNERLDTIREGTSIFNALLKRLEVKRVITSGVGIREGVYLSDLLRNSNLKFPANFNPSIRNLIDIYIIDKKNPAFVASLSKRLFNILSPIYNIDEKYKEPLLIASKLAIVGSNINFYTSNENSFYFILNALNYKLTHRDKILIAILAKFHKNRLPSLDLISDYAKYLPPLEIINYLNYILTLAMSLNINLSREKIEFNFENKKLFISSKSSLYLAKERIKKLDSPFDFKIEFKEL